MRITSQHWISRVQRSASPHLDQRQDPKDIALVVIHCISLPQGRYGTPYVDDLFQGRLDTSVHPSFADLSGVRVSAHVVIDRRGRCVQYVPFDQRAWHAGVSQWNRRQGCNDFGIGIELEGTETSTYTARQYRSLNRLLAALLERYPRLHPGAIVGHCEIAPQRKRDPGPKFDWVRCLQGLDC